MAVRWPEGIRSAGVSAGIKSDGAPDLGVLVADEPVEWAGTFTRNAAAAACVQWSRARRGGQVRAIVANSGNANACTGRAGERAVEEVAVGAARLLDCTADEILVASTGPIGVPLSGTDLVRSLPTALHELSGEADPFARAILTTDTTTKHSYAERSAMTVMGVAKGAAMLAPNMATMLAFLVTDAHIDGQVLQGTLTRAVHTTFDRVSVDACESTNDSVFLLSTGRVPTQESDLAAALADVCGDLAEQMVRDGEGTAKVVRIQVSGAADDEAAVALGRAIASSSLWRSAAGGGDPNWGRVLAALGASDRSLDPRAVTLSIGPEVVFDRGEPTGSLTAAAKAMTSDDFSVSCVVGRGPGDAEVLSSDLTSAYVELNAGGLT